MPFNEWRELEKLAPQLATPKWSGVPGFLVHSSSGLCIDEITGNVQLANCQFGNAAAHQLWVYDAKDRAIHLSRVSYS